MRVQIDQDRCTGHGRCYSVAPEVFDCDDDGFGQVSAPEELPPGLAEQAELGRSSCPEEAISIVEQPDPVPRGAADEPGRH